MAVVEKTIDIIGDDGLCDIILSKQLPAGYPVDIYDEAVTSLRAYALYGIQGVQSFSFPNVTRLNGYCFSNARNLKRVELPACISMQGNDFRENSALEEVVAPLLQSVGQYQFVWTRTLKHANFPNLLGTGDGCFYGCEELESCNLPKLRQLGYATFLDTPKLRQIDLPSIVSIGESCISGEYIPEGSETPAARVMNLGPNLTGIHASAFSSAPAGMIVNMPLAEGAIAGAPWGGVDIVINYEVPYSGDVPMPEN